MNAHELALALRDMVEDIYDGRDADLETSLIAKDTNHIVLLINIRGENARMKRIEVTFTDMGEVRK